MMDTLPNNEFNCVYLSNKWVERDLLTGPKKTLTIFLNNGGHLFDVTFRPFVMAQFCPTFDMLLSGPNNTKIS